MVAQGMRTDSPMNTTTKERAPYKGWMNDQGFIGDMETKHETLLKVSGTIPQYAAGTLYRTGPGGYKVKTADGHDFAMSHWFDGFTKVHRFQIIPESTPNGVKVIYNSRSTVDDHLEKIRKNKKLEGFSFGQKRDPCESFFKKAQSSFFDLVRGPPGLDSNSPSSENVGVTLSVNFPGNPGGKGKTKDGAIRTLHTKTDASPLQALDPETLEPIGVVQQTVLHPDLKGPMSAAHAKSDPETGDVFNFNLDFGPRPTYRVFRVSSATGKTDILATFSATPTYLHSLFLTEDHVILCLWNSQFSKGGASMLWTRNILDAIVPDNTKPALWYVIDRRHGKGVLATYESDAFFCFHTINAWTETSASGKVDIVCDLVTYESAECIKYFMYENLCSTSPRTESQEFQAVVEMVRPVYRRYRLPDVPDSPRRKRTKANLAINAPKDSSMELPTFNGKYCTRKHRFTYGISARGQASFADGLTKLDTETMKPLYWSEFAQSPGEPIFVVNPDGGDEDDGVLLSVVLDGNAGTSYLLCLSAKDMTELGRASLDCVVGFGFHGVHVKSSGQTLDL